MEGIYEWVKNIVCYLIFITVLMNVLPAKKYEKYMRLFAGMVLLLLVLKPLTGSLRLEERIAYYYRAISFEKEVESLQEEALGLEEERRKRLFSQYRSAIASDVALMAENAGFSVQSAAVELKENEKGEGMGAVKRIELILSRAGEEKSQGELEDGAAPIEVERISVPGGALASGSDSGEGAPFDAWGKPERTEEAQAVNRLRRQIAVYYNLEETYVEIKMEDE